MATKKSSKSSLPTFTVGFKLDVTIGVEVQAESFEKALEYARTLKTINIISDKDHDVYDYEVAVITSIFKK